MIDCLLSGGNLLHILKALFEDVSELSKSLSFAIGTFDKISSVAGLIKGNVSLSEDFIHLPSISNLIS